jgi:hypothetical protein
MTIIPIIFISLLLILLIIWSICDSAIVNNKKINLGAQYLIHQYMQKSYLQIVVKLLNSNQDNIITSSSPNYVLLKNQTSIVKDFDKKFKPISIYFTQRLERFIRGKDILQELYHNQQSNIIDLFLFPDTFIEKTKTCYYLELLSHASETAFSKNLYKDFTNGDAKVFLEHL